MLANFTIKTQKLSSIQTANCKFFYNIATVSSYICFLLIYSLSSSCLPLCLSISHISLSFLCLFITFSSVFTLHHFTLHSSSLRSSLLTIFFIFSLVDYPSLVFADPSVVMDCSWVWLGFGFDGFGSNGFQDWFVLG